MAGHPRLSFARSAKSWMATVRPLPRRGSVRVSVRGAVDISVVATRPAGRAGRPGGERARPGCGGGVLGPLLHEASIDDAAGHGVPGARALPFQLVERGAPAFPRAVDRRQEGFVVNLEGLPHGHASAAVLLL